MRADARDFLAAPRPERPDGRRFVTFPIAVGSDVSYRSVGADAHIGPLSGFTGTASFAVTPQPCLRRPTFSVAPEKVGKKMRWRRVILRVDAREFLAAPRPERPLRAQNCYFPDSLWFRRMYYTRLRVDCNHSVSAHFRNTRRRADVHPQGVGRIRSDPSSLTAALAIGPYNMLCMSTTRRVFRK